MSKSCLQCTQLRGLTVKGRLREVDVLNEGCKVQGSGEDVLVPQFSCPVGRRMGQDCAHTSNELVEEEHVLANELDPLQLGATLALA